MGVSSTGRVSRLLGRFSLDIGNRRRTAFMTRNVGYGTTGTTNAAPWVATVKWRRHSWGKMASVVSGRVLSPVQRLPPNGVLSPPDPVACYPARAAQCRFASDFHGHPFYRTSPRPLHWCGDSLRPFAGRPDVERRTAGADGSQVVPPSGGRGPERIFTRRAGIAFQRRPRHLRGISDGRVANGV